MVAAINDEDAIMIVIDRKAMWIHELARLVAFLAELGHERASIITRECLHSIVVSIGDEQETSMMIECQTVNAGEHGIISISIFLDANRELDSSITIKRIVSHLLFHFNISLTQRQGDAPSSKLLKPKR